MDAETLMIMEANRRHDAEKHMLSMDPDARYPCRNLALGNVVTGPLTDRKIEQYEEKGFYSAEYREARKAWQEQKAARRRQGNFEMREGRMIYSPK